MRLHAQSSSLSLPLRTLSALFLALLVFCLVIPPAQAQGTPAGAVPPTMFGLSFNNPAASPAWPLAEPITYGLFRVWDSVGAQWPAIQTAPGTGSGSFTWTTLASDLANASSNGDTTAFYTMNRTPSWALGTISGNCTTNPNQPICDQRCNYYDVGGVTTGAGAPGQCYPPADLNPDGTGSDQTWKNWVTALSNEAVTLCSAGGYACIQYYEIWNEVFRNNQGYAFPGSSYAAPYLAIGAAHNYGNSYYGSFAQLVRMTQDAVCIIQGKSALKSKTVGTTTYPNAIDNAGGVGIPQSCTLSGTQSATSAYPAQIVAPSGLAESGPGRNVIQDILYCSVASTTTGAPNWCNTGTDAAWDLDIINFHMKPADATNGWNEEAQMLTQYCSVEGTSVSECSGTGSAGILQAAERAKPFWNGEAGYVASSTGWQGKNGALDITGNPDMQASFIARYAVTQWSLGISSFSWYEYDLDSYLNGSSPNGTGAQAGDPALAWSTVNSWLVGQTMTVAGVATSCSITAGTTTQWSCPLQGPNGFIGKVIWDIGTAYSCNADSLKGNDCTYTTPVSPSGTWHKYRDLWGVEHTYTGSIALSNLPILLENKSLF